MSMIDELRDNWSSRSQTEKIIIFAFSLVVLSVCFYLWVVEPLHHWKSIQERKLAANYKKLPEVEQLVQMYQRQGKKNNNEKKELVSIVNQSLSAHGLSMQGFQPGKNNSARLSLNDVQYQPLINWLYDVEYKHYLTIEEFSLIKTKKIGLLNATIYLRD